METVTPQVWGPPLWVSIHYIALYYPEEPTLEDKKNYFEFFKRLGAVIPCHMCQTHYREHFEALDIRKALNSTKELFEWTVNLHNKVNEMLGKPLMDYEDAYNLYTPNHVHRITYKVSPKLAISFAVIFILLVAITSKRFFARKQLTK